MARIFISYSRKDRQFVDQLIPLIRSIYGNDSVWFDDDIHGGIDWWQMILDEIAKCDIFIYLISTKSLESPYCQAEMQEALRLNKAILPVIVRRLRTQYPGTIIPELGGVLRRIHYVDISSGFNAKNIPNFSAALARLLETLPKQPAPPRTNIPTPEPSVPDKRNYDPTLMAAIIGGLCVLAAAIITGIFGLWEGVFANVTPPPTLSGFQILQTAEAELTQAASKQVVFDMTATAQFIYNSKAMGTAQQFGATETAAFATLFALSATPVPDPLQIAATPVSRNADWTPFERDFDGVTMVLVPAGCFMMGSTNNEDEQPVHEQCFDQPFWIDKYEVTQAQFQQLGGKKANQSYFSADARPVESITWFEAQDFCELRGGKLPTEAEWEYAARGPNNFGYPWGDLWKANNAAWNRNRSQGTANVGSFPAGVSWVGALDMSGNVWEWTSSLYESYPYDAADGREADTGLRTDVLRVLRGGSWDDYVTIFLRAPNRLRTNPYFRRFNLGTRCVRSFEQS